MKRVVLILIVLCAFFAEKSYSQPQNWNRYFGDSAALNFSSGSPVLVTGSNMNVWEGCATISDASGNLLFYTDGVSVWNKNNIVMPNGTGLFGGWSSTQAALIIPKPDSANIFYIFTIEGEGYPEGMNYS